MKIARKKKVDYENVKENLSFPPTLLEASLEAREKEKIKNSNFVQMHTRESEREKAISN